MTALTGKPFVGPSGLAAKSARRRGQIRVQALQVGQLQINVPSTPSEQHFGTRALEQFEKAKLGEFDGPGLTALMEELKERVSGFKPDLTNLPALPDFHGLGDAVSKFFQSDSAPKALGTALDTFKSSGAATKLSLTIPADGQFAPHWGSDAISGVLDVVSDSSREVLHQIVNELIQKLGSSGL